MNPNILQITKKTRFWIILLIYCLQIIQPTNACYRSTPPSDKEIIPDGGSTNAAKFSWNLWTTWSNCDVTCGIGRVQRIRTCVIKWFEEEKDSNKCLEFAAALNVSGGVVETKPCDNLVECPKPVDGGWSSWTSWNNCFPKCVNANISSSSTRTRRCNSPTPENGGKPCDGSKQETRICSDIPFCAVPGGWSDWKLKETCTPNTQSTDCSEGTEILERMCDNPPPAHGGTNCIGQLSKSRECWYNVGCSDKIQQPTNFRVSLITNAMGKPQMNANWHRTPFGESATHFLLNCATFIGESQVKIPIVEPRSAYGEDYNKSMELQQSSDMHTISIVTVSVTGKQSDEIKKVNYRVGSVDGNWSLWSPWSTCSVSCTGEQGNKKRTRKCTNPLPQRDGARCPGEDSESNNCFGIDFC